MTDDEALRLALERSALEAGSDVNGCKSGADVNDYVTPEDLLRRLGIVIGDMDEENARIVMQFLSSIGSEQGVREYIEEVLLERAIENVAAWEELGPLPRDIARHYGWCN